MESNKLINFIAANLNRKNILLLTGFVLVILFLKPLQQFYDKTVVNTFLKEVQTTWYIDLIFILLFIINISIVSVYLRNNKKFSSVFLCILSFFFFLFLLSKYFLKDHYQFYGFKFFPVFKYADTLYVLFGSSLLLKIKDWRNKELEPKNFGTPFLVDAPIKSHADDKFSRKEFAISIAKKIQSKVDVVEAGSLAIGINGLWGSGKTSFTYMIKEVLEKENRVVIDFNPWRSSFSQQIIEDYFKLMITELSKYDLSLSSNIARYAKTLTENSENIITRSANTIGNFLFEDVSKNQSYNRINDAIRKSKKQIIIFIDDLDRLDKKEIIEVLRIIRNTANFNNVVYIVSYDKGYIQTAIKDFNEYNYKSFIEKIFQFEFTLPMYEHGVLRTEIKKQLEAALGEKFQAQISRVVDTREYYGINFTNEIVKTYRDVIRFVNSLLFEIEAIQEEVFFYDFYLLQLLKLEYPKVYEALIENRYKFFTPDREKGIYILKTESEAWISDDVLSFSKQGRNDSRNPSDQNEEKKISSFESYLQDNSDSLGLNEHDRQLLKYLVETLLILKASATGTGFFTNSKEPRYQEQDIQLYKSFSYPRNFHKYFAFKLYEGDISAMEFEDYRRREVSEYKAKVFEWIKQGKYSVLVDRLEKIEDFITIQEFENQILILIEIGNYLLKENPTDAYFLDYTLIKNNLRYPIQGKRNIRLYSSKENYTNFLIETFKNINNAPIYESHVIKRLIAEKVDVGLSFDQLSKINFEYFKNYCGTHQEVTPEFRQLHSNAIRLVENFNNDYEIIPEAQGIFVKYFLENLKGSELAGFVKHTNPRSDYFHIEYEWIKTFFPEDVWGNLENYLERAENIKKQKEYYEEFLKFYHLFKANMCKPVQYIFKHLQPNLWNEG